MIRVIFPTLLALIFGTIAGAASAAPCAGEPLRRFFVAGVREGDRLYLRSGPSPRAQFIAIIPRDSSDLMGLGPVQRYGQSLWRKVRYGTSRRGLTGWVNDSYLRLESSRIPPTSSFSVTGVRKGDVLYVRAWPSAKSKEVAALPCDATGIVGIRVWMKGGQIWRRVRFDSMEGWANGAFLQPEDRGPKRR